MRHLGAKVGEFRSERLGDFADERFDCDEPVDEVVTTLDKRFRRSGENADTPAVRSSGHSPGQSPHPRWHRIEATNVAAAILGDEFFPELLDGLVVRRARKRWGWFSRPREHQRWPLPVGIRNSLIIG
jgi:hypothetical protein